MQLNLGCGIHLVSGFVNIDVAFSLADLKRDVKAKKGVFENAVIEKGAKFIQCDMKKLPFKDNSVDYIESNCSIEHIPMNEVIVVFCEIHRVLKPGCHAVIVTTDFADLARMYLEECNKEDFDTERFFRVCSFIYGNQITSGEYHCSAFSPWYLKRLSDTAGFKDIKVILHPRYTVCPKLRTVRWSKGMVLTSDFLYAKLTK